LVLAAKVAVEKRTNGKKYCELSNEIDDSLWNHSYVDDRNALLATSGNIIEDSEFESSL